MKLAISTITDGANYGNRLQNYALQCFLEQQGFDVETIRRKTYREVKPYIKVYRIIKDIAKILFGRT